MLSSIRSEQSTGIALFVTSADSLPEPYVPSLIDSSKCSPELLPFHDLVQSLQINHHRPIFPLFERIGELYTPEDLVVAIARA